MDKLKQDRIEIVTETINNANSTVYVGKRKPPAPADIIHRTNGEFGNKVTR
jgi:hypothetical protein